MANDIDMGNAQQTTEAITTLNEKVGVPFTITLEIGPASERPGPVWLSSYDSQYLTVVQCGYNNDYAGNQTFWCQFNPTAAGSASANFVQQPHLINPLFIGHPYEIIITN